jgi:hypothetical protein
MMETSQSKQVYETTMALGSQLASGKWAEYVDGLEGSTRDITALLLENEAQYLDNLDETTKVVNIGNFYKFAFPMVRAIFPNLIAMDIVSVQPMSGPVSLVFYLDFLYGTTKGDVTTGDRLYRSGFPAASNVDANFTDPTQFDGHDGNFQYSSETVNLEATAPVSGTQYALDGSGALTVGANAGLFTFKPVRPTSATLFAGSSRTTAVAIANSNADGSWTAAGATVISAGAIDYANGNYSVTISGGTASAKLYMTYKFAAEGTPQVAEINLQLQSTSVTAERRALQASWSVEAANDLRAIHNLDVEAELTAVLADEIRFEIDREIITDLDSISTSTTNGAPARIWSRNIAGINYAYYEKKMEFYDELIAMSNLILKQTRRAGGNFVVCGLDVANTIEALPGFQPTNVVGNGVVKVGTIRGQYDVYKDPYLLGSNSAGNEYIMGYKGNSFLDAGYVFAPYIPLYTTPTYVFTDFVGKKGMMSRYGKKVINNRFYLKGRVTA